VLRALCDLCGYCNLNNASNELSCLPNENDGIFRSVLVVDVKALEVNGANPSASPIKIDSC